MKDHHTPNAAAEIITWRHQVLTNLEHQGVLTIDTFPEHMTTLLINRYLEIKACHLLSAQLGARFLALIRWIRDNSVASETRLLSSGLP